MNHIKLLYQRLTQKYWTIGFSEYRDIRELQFSDIRWVNDMPGEWIADPFILDYNDTTITVLVEYVMEPDPIGKIAKVVIDRKSLKILSKTIILSLPTHLSFPVILRKEDGIYFYPENSASGELNLYKLNSDATGCEKITTLVKAPLTDAIIFRHDDLFIMTATKEPDSNKNILLVYKSFSEFGPYHLVEKKYLNSNTARNAGYTLEKSDGLYYKISQENDIPIYGHGMVFYEVSPDLKYMNEVNRIQPERDFIGVHTMNPYKDLIVWDGKKYRYPIIAKVLNFLNNIIRKL